MRVWLEHCQTYPSLPNPPPLVQRGARAEAPPTLIQSTPRSSQETTPIIMKQKRFGHRPFYKQKLSRKRRETVALQTTPLKITECMTLSLTWLVSLVTIPMMTHPQNSTNPAYPKPAHLMPNVLPVAIVYKSLGLNCSCRSPKPCSTVSLATSQT